MNPENRSMRRKNIAVKSLIARTLNKTRGRAYIGWTRNQTTPIRSSYWQQKQQDYPKRRRAPTRHEIKFLALHFNINDWNIVRRSLGTNRARLQHEFRAMISRTVCRRYKIFFKTRRACTSVLLKWRKRGGPAIACISDAGKQKNVTWQNNTTNVEPIISKSRINGYDSM